MGNCARHVAVIMDGNGRWAEARGFDRLAGHAQGVEALSAVVRAATDSPQVEVLTVYAFSTENWGRPEAEVDGLMELLAATILKKVEPLAQAGVKLRFIGNRDALPQGLRRTMDEAEQIDLQGPLKLLLVVALNYGGREDLVRAVERLVADAGGRGVEGGGKGAGEGAGGGSVVVDEQAIAQRLTTNGLPDVDLLIRTSGEYRLSNFLLWETSYAELYFTEVLWPDFGANEFQQALDWFASRSRRFGLVSDIKMEQQNREETCLCEK